MDVQMEYENNFNEIVKTKSHKLSTKELANLFIDYFKEENIEKKSNYKEQLYWAMLPMVIKKLTLYNKNHGNIENKYMEEVYSFTAECLDRIKNPIDKKSIASFLAHVHNSIDRTLYSLIREDNNCISLEDVKEMVYYIDDEKIDNQFMNSILNDCLSTLSEREQQVIKLRFGFEDNPMTLEEVGKIFGVTGNRIMQIEAKALRRLRSKRCSALHNSIDIGYCLDTIDRNRKPQKKYIIGFKKRIQKVQPKNITKKVYWHKSDAYYYGSKLTAMTLKYDHRNKVWYPIGATHTVGEEKENHDYWYYRRFYKL